MDQPGAGTQLSLIRVVTALSALETLRQMPAGKTLELFADNRGEGGNVDGKNAFEMTPRAYAATRVVAAIGVALWGAGVRNAPTAVCANLGFGLAQKHVVDFHKKAWNYNSHINAFMALLSIADAGGRDPDPAADKHAVDSAALAILQLYYATMYLQSGLAKVRVSGLRWGDGRTLRASLAEHGNALGKRMSRLPQGALAGAASGSLVFEFLFPLVMLALWHKKTALGVMSIGFHSIIKATMNISFWHHSVFALPLFVAPADLRRAAEKIQQFFETD
ncbi:hypothetical protein ACFTY7_28250 [Streptomyces sp. NPDC057062]|uniref:hypothetical protein n=1 Tax=Streptomyces sp. NPDC057062 TaxID=3346011 RepID=UPI003645D476